jgi:hypothetical protein
MNSDYVKMTDSSDNSNYTTDASSVELSMNKDYDDDATKTKTQLLTLKDILNKDYKNTFDEIIKYIVDNIEYIMNQMKDRMISLSDIEHYNINIKKDITSTESLEHLKNILNKYSQACQEILLYTSIINFDYELIKSDLLEKSKEFKNNKSLNAEMLKKSQRDFLRHKANSLIIREKILKLEKEKNELQYNLNQLKSIDNTINIIRNKFRNEIEYLDCFIENSKNTETKKKCCSCIISDGKKTKRKLRKSKTKQKLKSKRKSRKSKRRKSKKRYLF